MRNSSVYSPATQMANGIEFTQVYHTFSPLRKEDFNNYTFHNSMGLDESGMLVKPMQTDTNQMCLDTIEAAEQIKHRRTRSGCFTCRARRVKCDEARPVCDRCSKGSRQCTFPEATEAPKGSRAKKRSLGQMGTKPTLNAERSSGVFFKEASLSPDVSGEQSPLHQSKTSTSSSSLSLQGRNKPFSGYSSLPWDHPDTHKASDITATSPECLQDNAEFWLDFFQDNIKFHHYFLVDDADNFLHRKLPNLARQDEALLYSIVSLSAFHYFIGAAEPVHTPSNRVPELGSAESFFLLHNKAITLLRSSFQANPIPSLHGLLAVLHLSLVEEYLGQWDNMVQHRRGASMIMSALFSPESISDSPEGRFVFSWMTRLDLGISMWCGLQTVLEPRWYEADYHKARLQWSQTSINMKLLVAAAQSSSRYITMQVVNLLDARFSGLDDYDTYQQSVAAAMEEIESFWALFSPDTVSQLLGYSENLAIGLQDNINSLHNLLRYTYCEVHTMKLLLQHQQSVVQQFPTNIYSQCGLVCDLVWEIVQTSDQAQGLPLLPLQPTLALIAAFCKNDQLRKYLCIQFQHMEQVGFVFPTIYRFRLSSLWQDPAIKLGWHAAHAHQHTDQAPSADGLDSRSRLLTTIRAFAQITTENSLPINQNFRKNSMRNIFSFADIDLQAVSSIPLELINLEVSAKQPAQYFKDVTETS